MQPTRTVATVGFTTTSLAIIVVPLVLVHAADRSEYFWWRIAWADFLAILAWSSLGGLVYASKAVRSMPRIAGVAPAYDLVILPYAVLSSALLVGFAWLDPTDGPNRIHMAVQVVLLASVIIVAALLYLAAHFAAIRSPQDARMDHGTRSVRHPFDLAAQLRSEEDRFATPGSSGAISEVDRNLHQALKSLREKITYSLEGVAGVEDDPEYGKLADRVASVCCSLSTIQTGGRSSAEADAMVREVQLLGRMVANISNGLKGR
jgi:hypothetical protein